MFLASSFSFLRGEEKGIKSTFPTKMKINLSQVFKDNIFLPTVNIFGTSAKSKIWSKIDLSFNLRLILSFPLKQALKLKQTSSRYKEHTKKYTNYIHTAQ